MKQLMTAGFALVLAICGNANADPVVYTAQVVTDGKLGSLKFADAPVTITFRGDTSDMSMNTSGGVVTYRIDEGHATVAVNVQGTITVARITDGQIYVHYDVQTGVVGFGSDAVSPYYPLTLSCDHNHTNCYYNANGTAYASNQTVSALAKIDADAAEDTNYSARVDNLPQTLRKSTLLTGYASACVVPYSFQAGQLPCASQAPVAIETSMGGLYLQDQTLGKGIFTVQVSRRDD